MKCSDIKTALVGGDQWYLVGGRKVFKVSLKKLLDTVLDSKTVSTEVWSGLSDISVNASCVSAVGESVIALGGKKKKAVLIYDPDKWTSSSISDLPIPLSNSTALTLTSGDIMVIGGEDKKTLNDVVFKIKTTSQFMV